MEIRWLGHACFTITHNGYTLAIDPYNSDYVTGYPKLRGVKADKLLISHDSYGHNYREGVELFADIAEQYDDITELDREILNRLIAKIVVGDRIRENGQSSQQVTVYYNFIGNL